jgi:hypothetical protein
MHAVRRSEENSVPHDVCALVGVVEGEADQGWFVEIVTCPLRESPFPLSVAVGGGAGGMAKK